MNTLNFRLFLIVTFLWLGPQQAFSWSHHNVLTQAIFKDVKWIEKFNTLKVTSFDQFLLKAYPNKKTTEKDFLAQNTLNTSYQISYNPKKTTPRAVVRKALTNSAHRNSLKLRKPGQITSALEILVNHVDEPDWGMDQNLNVSKDQPFMGGTKGPTSQAFRHLYWKRWSAKAPWRTFHIPPREMGEALKRTQLYFDLAQKAYEIEEPYWTFRFLAWALHYVQDLSQPFHSTQLLTPQFIAWDSIFNFKKLVKRCTQIISNFHFLYEYYVIYKVLEEKKDKRKAILLPTLSGTDYMESSSAYLIARHSADSSNKQSYKIGQTVYTFFGKESLDPNVDVPNMPIDKFPMKKFDASSRISKKQKQQFLKNTAKCLKKTAYYSRSLLELAKSEFLKSTGR